RELAPSPLDEVRSAMAFFDETLFTVTPALYRALERAIDPASGERPASVHAFVRWGSWIGSDRDGHPAVTADVTVATARIQADHLMRAYERVAERLLASLAIDVETDAVGASLRASLRRNRSAFRRLGRELESHYPGQPYRWALGFMRERLRRTRDRLVAEEARSGAASSGAASGYASAEELRADVAAIADSLAGHGAVRAAHGSVQELAWQVETFGLHLASLEVRQHRAVHAAALAALDAGIALDRPLEVPEAAGTVTTSEVLDTMRAAWTVQASHGEEACHRYVVSFTERPADVLAVLELARRSRAADPRHVPESGDQVPLDVVPLLESSTALDSADELLSALLADRGYRRHLAGRGNRQEVMLGYSDSNRELGFLAAAWSLYRAQARLVAAARRAGVDLLLFHGRGGAIGRGGGPANRAVLAQPAGSVDGRLKLTQQGEVIAARFADQRIALRELEQMTHAVVLASVRDRDPRAGRADRRWWAMLDELANLSWAAYRRLVWDDRNFSRFFALATPIDIIAAMQLGSRPAARGRAGGPPSPEAVRAIPWVFAWSQARIGLPGWYGLGSALSAYRRAHGARGFSNLRRAVDDWPFLASTLDTAAVSLAVADMHVGAAYADLAGDDQPMRRIWQAIAREHALSVTELLELTGRSRLLEAQPWLEQRIARRNPYVDALSGLQRTTLRELRALRVGDPRWHRLERLAQVTISGIAAGLQHTG
ncbi:MAG: phosphoenolpyruvate carboxylase, partial [Candidatus Limnocylindria bacterium]